MKYLTGFGNELESEAYGYTGVLPRTLNPQHCKENLIAEQLSGSAFTAPRATNKRSWLYRIRPSVSHGKFKPYKAILNRFSFADGVIDPNQRRWTPFENAALQRDVSVDFVDGLHTLAFSNSDGCADSSVAIHIYLANASMINRSFVNSDGDLLIVPQRGELFIRTEFGCLTVGPNEIAIIQQGMKFSVTCEPTTESRGTSDANVRGYILEVKGNHFELPNLGPIGANGLANPRDFQVPTACVDTENLESEHQVILKFQNSLFTAKQNHSPYNVAAWLGNYTPYKYELNKFVSVNSVSVDHPDPSIFTVLTCPSHGKPGTALADFVIFPPRWECAEGTFRPPYFHRNCMTEFMGLIKGQYQAKSKTFAPGGGSLHQTMMPHGPDKEAFKIALEQDTTKPRKITDDTMAFMFETSLTLKLSQWACNENVDNDYQKCWEGLSELLTDDSFPYKPVNLSSIPAQYR